MEPSMIHEYLSQRALSCVKDNLGFAALHETATLYLQSSSLMIIPSLLIGALVLRLYRSRITKLMKLQHDLETQPGAKSQPFAEMTSQVKNSNEFGLGSPEKITGLAASRVIRYRNWILGVALSHLVILCVFCVYNLLQLDSEDKFLARLIGSLMYVGVFALFSTSIFTLVFGTPRVAEIVWSVTLPLMLLLSYPYVLAGGEYSLYELLILQVFFGLIASVVYAALCGRQLRNIVPYLTISFAFALFVWHTLQKTYLVTVCTLEIRDDLYRSDMISFLFPIVVLFFVVCAVRWVAGQYRDKRLSDTQIQVCSWLIIMSLISSLLFETGAEDQTALRPFTFFIIPVTVVMIGVFLYGTRIVGHWPYPQRLLFFRVFKDDARGEKTLNKVEHLWRHLGPIYLIAGPDLAKTGADPDELYLYITGKIKSIFIANQSMVDSRLGTIDNKQDPDGRYRVNELFCYDSAWEAVALGLVYKSDAVLLDMRDFHSNREGATKEIGFLNATSAFPRTIILVDDEQNIEQRIKDIENITKTRVSASQFVTPASTSSQKLVERLLALRQLDLARTYQQQVSESAGGILAAEHSENTLKKRQQRMVELHEHSDHSFSFLLLYMGFLGMAVGGLFEYSAVVYLLYRRVNYKYVAWFFSVTLIFWIVFYYLIPEMTNLLVDKSQNTRQLIYTAMNITGVAGWLLCWVGLCRHVNRWIAEAQEPLRSALLQLNTQDNTN